MDDKIVIYETSDGETSIEVKLEGETVWLSANQMALLFDRDAITCMKNKFGGSSLFGNEKDDSFKSSIGQIYQTFGGVDLYPSVEEKAAMLLYLVTKNHSFSDGNKRIAAVVPLAYEQQWYFVRREWRQTYSGQHFGGFDFDDC